MSLYANALVVGSGNDDDMGSDSGSAYVFSRPAAGGGGGVGGSCWSQEAKLLAGDGKAGHTFGQSVRGV